MLLNDSQHLLDEALRKLAQVQEIERLQDDAAAWAALPGDARREKEHLLAESRRFVANDFQLGKVIVRILQFTTEDRAVAACYFDPAVRNRTAKINDYFLKYLTVPEERRKLKVKQQQELNWDPRELVTELSQIHLNLFRARPQEWVEAVAADTDYYGRFPSMFAEQLTILRTLGLLPEGDIADLERMVAEVEQRKATAEAEEEDFGEVPDEFADEILATLMRNPVRLPSGHVVDYATVKQQILTDPRDPFSRQPCTLDDLQPLPELAERIAAWVEEQRARRRGGGAAAVDGMQVDG